MTWSSVSNTATIRWYGFADRHAPLVMYYVTLNGRIQSLPAVTNNDEMVYSLTMTTTGLVRDRRYRTVVRGVNAAGLSASVSVVVETFGNGQLNILHELCDAMLCERQYSISAADSSSNGCIPGPGVEGLSPRTCLCAFSVAYCVNFAADVASVSSTVLNNVVVVVRDGFQYGVDIDLQAFTNVLGASWTVRPLNCFSYFRIVSFFFIFILEFLFGRQPAVHHLSSDTTGQLGCCHRTGQRRILAWASSAAPKLGTRFGAFIQCLHADSFWTKPLNSHMILLFFLIHNVIIYFLWTKVVSKSHSYNA